MTKKEIKKVSLYLFAIIVVSVVLSILGSKINTKYIEEFIVGFGIFGPIMFVFLLTLSQVFAPLSGTPIYISGYLLFGETVIVYNYVSYLFATVINFIIARRWGRKWVIKLVGQDDISRVDSFVADQGVTSLIFLRVLQSHISDFVSYAYGLTRIKFRSYFVISVIAPIPWLLLWEYYIFPKVNNVGDFSLWFFVSMVPLFIISWMYIKYKSRKSK